MNKQKHIDEIMDWFDFSRVAKVMEALEWKWVDYPKVDVPEEPEIRQSVRENLNSCIDKAIEKGGKYEFSTGGFLYFADAKKDYVHLSFVVASWLTNEY